MIQYEQRIGKSLDEDVKIGVILALAPPSVHNHYHLNPQILKSYAQVRTMLSDYCRAHEHVAVSENVPCMCRCIEGARRAKATRKGRDKNGKGEGKHSFKATE